MEKHQSEFDSGLFEKQIHFYATDEEIILRKIPNCRTFEQILMQKITSDEQISEIYSCINQKIESYRLISAKPETNLQAQIANFLLLKGRMYFSFYSSEFRVQEIRERLGMFQIYNLYELFVDIHRIRDQVKNSIYKLHGLQKRQTKINGCYLIFKIESLMKEIVNAAFPYLLFPRPQNKIIVNTQTYVLSQFELILLQTEMKKMKKFTFQEMHPLKNSLLELNDEMETIKMEISKQSEAYGNINIRQSVLVRNEIDMVEKMIRMGKLQTIKFNHQFSLYLDGFIHRKPQDTLEACQKFIAQSPILLLDAQQIQEFANQRRQSPILFGNCHKYFKFLIHNLNLISEKEYQKSTFQKCMVNLLNLLERDIKMHKYCDNLLLFENYISALRIQNKINRLYIQKNEDNISQIIKEYLEKLMNYYINQHWIIINRTVSFEQDFTYYLLTTNKIVQTLIEYQDKFTLLIDEFAPQLEMLIQISKIKLKNNDKKLLIEDALNKIYYLSSKDEGYFNSNQSSKLKEKKDVSFNMEIILSIEHDSLYQVKPYLRQIKYILMLVGILRRKDIKRNINKMQQEQFGNLKKIAAYFSKERIPCVIYELKSKILLFITLFKMGYHNPTIRQEQKLVNLRNRIINLYNKLYSNNSANMMLSRLNSISSRRSNSQESYIIYDPQSVDLKASVSDSILRSESEPHRIEIQATQELVSKINKFIMVNFVNKENNSKLYLTNLLNILEHELFSFEKDINQENQSQLSRDYTDHLKVCMGFDQNQLNPNVEIILNIQRLFYLGQYEKAWTILTKEKLNNKQFNQYLEKIESSSINNQILKFLRLFNLFEKMNHILFTDLNKSTNIHQLTEMINTNSPFTIPKNAIQIIYEIKARQNRLNQLEKFYLSRLNEPQSMNAQYSLIESFLSKQSKGEIKIYKLQKINKIILKIEIGKSYAEHFEQLNSELKKFYLFNQIGIFKLNDFKIQDKMRIQIQSNPFILKDEENIFKSKIIEFSQNIQEKFCRKILQFIIQALHIFYDQNTNNLNNQQISLSTQPLSFCVNPFYGIIQKIIRKKSQKKKHNAFITSIKNRHIIENIIQPFLPHFSDCFKYHYFFFLESLTNLPKLKSKTSINKLLQLPLFMTLQEKQVFLVYFDNKMSDMCDSFHEQQRKLRKQKKYPQIQKLRRAKMKEQTYKNYSYHFIIGGTVQAQMIQLKICSQNKGNRLDWISEHKNLKISYDLPKKEGSQQIKQYAYSLNYLLKYLRGALAHKIENNYKIILNISEEFPKIFDYLYKNKFILQTKFEAILTNKNQSLKEYFQINEKQRNRLQLIFQGKHQSKRQINADIQEAINILHSHAEKYELKIIKEVTKQAYKCEICNEFINLAKKSNNLFDLMQSIVVQMTKKNNFLIAEHNFKNCFLSQTFKTHRIMEIFGLMKRVQAKHYIIINWWFYLESELPYLMRSLEKVRYLLQQ